MPSMVQQLIKIDPDLLIFQQGYAGALEFLRQVRLLWRLIFHCRY
jgi:hypothetical protein